MRVLAFDHFFGQDLDALDGRLEGSLVRLPYERLHAMARATFPPVAFTGLAAAYDPSCAASWRAYEPRVHRLAAWLLRAHRPDVFVAPTDVIFYLRPLIEAFRQLGLRTVVVQKETTISPFVMDDHSREVAAYVPSIADAMTVCSDRQRRFWVQAGTADSRITVTGQPRFDLYRTAVAPRRPGPPRLLYLSYDDVAYLPSDTGLPFEGSWRDLRRSTEEVIAGVVDTWEVTAKRHPQQAPAETWLGPRARVAPADADTRRLILDADVVVGFQTTALFEAAAAGKPVLYAAWGPQYERMSPTLIPFHELPEVVSHVTSAPHLATLLAEPGSLVTAGPAPSALVEEHLGPLDGRATERVLDVLAAHARMAGRPPRPPRPPLPTIVRHGLAMVPGVSLSAVAPLAGPRFRRAGRRLLQEGREAFRVLRG